MSEHEIANAGITAIKSHRRKPAACYCPAEIRPNCYANHCLLHDFKFSSSKMRAFISYSHKDAELLTKLHEHLSALTRQNLIITWTDREIMAGGAIDTEIAQAMVEADLYLLLVSAAFIQSNYCYEKEFAKALERQKAGAAKIVPIIVRECDWALPELRQFKALPDDGKAVISRHWHTPDEAFTNVANGLRTLLQPKRTKAADALTKEKKGKFVPNETHVTKDEKEILGKLCDEVVQRLTAKTVFASEDEAKRKRGKYFGIVWAQFHEHFGTKELAALERTRFEEARSWFLQYRASKDKNFKRINPQKYRNTLTKTIHTIGGTLGWSRDQLHAFATEKLGYPNPITSLNDLGNQQLELVRDRIRYEATKKKVESGQARARGKTSQPLKAAAPAILSRWQASEFQSAGKLPPRLLRVLKELEPEEADTIDSIAAKVLFVEDCDGVVSAFLNSHIRQEWRLGHDREEAPVAEAPVAEIALLRELGLVETSDFTFEISVEGPLYPDKIHLSRYSVRRIFAGTEQIVPAHIQPQFLRTKGPTVTADGRPQINTWIKLITFDAWKITRLGESMFALIGKKPDPAHIGWIRERLRTTGVVLSA